MATVIFFGNLGDHVSPTTQSLNIGAEKRSALDIFEQFAESNPGLSKAKSSQTINVALNQKISDWNALVSEDDELAYLPPVTGG